jgi:hypothetical protein
VTDLGELWSRVVRYLREPLILLDTSDGRCIDANPAAADLMRTPPEAMRGSHLAEFAPRTQPDGRTSRTAIEAWARLPEASEHVMPWTIQRTSGETVPVELRLTAVPGAPDQRLWCLAWPSARSTSPTVGRRRSTWPTGSCSKVRANGRCSCRACRTSCGPPCTPSSGSPSCSRPARSSPVRRSTRSRWPTSCAPAAGYCSRSMTSSRWQRPRAAGSSCTRSRWRSRR